jgi:hypothetical protein
VADALERQYGVSREWSLSQLRDTFLAELDRPTGSGGGEFVERH